MEKENPIKGNRIVSDMTFAVRLRAFVERAEVNDLPSEEEKKYILNVADRLLKYQCATATSVQEVMYLKRLERQHKAK